MNHTKKVGERLEEILNKLYREGVGLQISNVSVNEAHTAILALFKSIVPEERHGKHLGHQEDDGYCYNCHDIVPEDEQGSFGDWAWNSYRTELLKLLEQV